MYHNKTRLSTLLVINGFLLLVDRIFKFLATHHWDQTHLLNKFFGWQPSINTGIAFGLPLPNQIIIILTIPIIIILIYLLWQPGYPFLKICSLWLILTGALSNLFDRLIYHHIIDYFLLFTAIINIADILITIGFVLYLFDFYVLQTKIGGRQWSRSLADRH
jgi:signal peptidase II